MTRFLKKASSSPKRLSIFRLPFTITLLLLFICSLRRSQWPHRLRHVVSSIARKMGSWVRIPFEARMCVSAFFCVALSCVYVEALRRADPPSKESYQMTKNNLISFRSQILNRKRPEDLIRIYFTLCSLCN
jgi:hypothetical protein